MRRRTEVTTIAISNKKDHRGKMLFRTYRREEHHVRSVRRRSGFYLGFYRVK